MTHTDQLNRKLQITEIPKRIVSLVPSQTELLVDLGLENSIVGVTKFCVHPDHLRKDKVIVGGTKQINPNKIKELKPDVILCNKEENTKGIIESLKDIAPIHISDIYNIDDCYELISMYSQLFNVQDRASNIIFNIKKEREQFQNSIKGSYKAKIAYFIWKNPWMVVGSKTFIDYMIKEAGFTNVFQDDTRYPEINLDNPKLYEADFIFLSSEPYPFEENHIEDLTSKFPKPIIKIVDGESFSWYGSRLQKSYNYFSEEIY